jgi:regulator of protease activity HflC (stomatin/prohibitin superfamily)
MAALVVVLVLLVIAGIVAAGRSLKVIQQYEKGVLYRFGRVQPALLQPGLVRIRPIGDRLARVNMQIVAMAVPAQDGITRDNVSVRVDAVVYFRVVDPIKATINVQNYMFAISQQAQTSLRSIIGQSEMDQLLAERDTVNKKLRDNIDEPTEEPWGIRVERVEIKDVSLPEGMKRSMSRQAEAERERRARIITADGEYQASKRLAAAAAVMAKPVPVELLRFFERMAPGEAAPTGSTALADAEAEDKRIADLGDAEVAAAEAAIAHASVPPVPGIPELGPVADVPLADVPLADVPLEEVPLEEVPVEER